MQNIINSVTALLGNSPNGAAAQINGIVQGAVVCLQELLDAVVKAVNINKVPIDSVNSCIANVPAAVTKLAVKHAAIVLKWLLPTNLWLQVCRIYFN